MPPIVLQTSFYYYPPLRFGLYCLALRNAVCRSGRQSSFEHRDISANRKPPPPPDPLVHASPYRPSIPQINQVVAVRFSSNGYAGYACLCVVARKCAHNTHALFPLLQRFRVTPSLDSDLTEGTLVKLGTRSSHSLSSCTDRAERRVGVRKVGAFVGRGMGTLLVRIVDRSWDTVGKV